MSTVEICMVIGLGMMFFMMIAVIYAAVKLSSIEDELMWIRIKLTTIVDNTRSVVIDTNYVKGDVADILKEVRAANEHECECGSTEDDLCGMNADVVVVDELVGDEEDELDIHLITPEEYHFANGYSKNELHYRPNTDQVKYYSDSCCAWCSMENIPEYIGDALVFFGMHVKEPNVVYVRNHALNADFRIEKVGGNHDE